MKLNPRVKTVSPQPDYTLKLVFTNGEERIFDVKPYLAKGIFQELRSPVMFNSVRVFLGSIQWRNEADLCPDTLYEKSVPVAKVERAAMRVAESKATYATKRKKGC